MKPLVLIFILGISAFNVLIALGQVKLRGQVRSEDLSPLQAASIYVARYSTGAYTDSLGEFQLIIPKGPCALSVSYIGFKTQQVNVFLARDTFIEVTLETSLLPEVTITEEKQARAVTHEEAGVMLLKKEIFYLLPTFLGENDPMRAVQMQPGIQSGNEGSRGIFVRGGSPDQNLMLLDGAPVYNPSHVYGFISVFNGDAIDHLAVYKDKYPARFGGRLCSVMDISSEEGNTEKLCGSISLGLVTSRLHLDGPLTKKKKTTFSFSARGCYVGLYTVPISKKKFASSDGNGSINYNFGDLNVKATHFLNEKNKLEINFFSNRDYYAYINKQEHNQLFGTITENSEYQNKVNWSNEVASVIWLNNRNEKWTLSSRVFFSRYSLNGSITDNYTSYSFQDKDTLYFGNSLTETQSFIYNAGCSEDAVFHAARHTVRFGAGANMLIYETGRGSSIMNNIYSGESTIKDSNDLAKAAEAFIYAEDEFVPNEKINIGFGIHGRSYSIERKTFINFLPRVSVLYNPVAEFFIRASAAGLSQNLHLLTASNADILNDYWVPATRKAAPETGWNFSAGVTQKLPWHFEWSVDGFYRLMTNLIEYKVEENYSLIDKLWEQKVVMEGEGRAYGAEFYFARTAGRITGSVAYTLAWSSRKFDELNRGEYFPYKYDRRHNIATQINWRIGRHFEVGAAWVYGSGNTYTLAPQTYHSWGTVSSYDLIIRNNYQYFYSSGQNIKVYGGKNNARLPPYHHLDVSLTYRKQRKKLEHIFNLSVYNVYNRFNIFSVYSKKETDNTGAVQTVYRQLSLFPVLPSITYTLKFSR